MKPRSPEKNLLSRRIDLIFREPQFEREDLQDGWSTLRCTRCGYGHIVEYEPFKRFNRDRALVFCPYCHAFSRRPGMTRLKIGAILKRQKKE